METEIDVLWTNGKQKLTLVKNEPRNQFFLKLDLEDFSYTYRIYNPENYKSVTKTNNNRTILIISICYLITLILALLL